MTDTKIFDLNNFSGADMKILAEALRSGKTAVIPTDTVYGLIVRAERKYLPKLNAVKANPAEKPAQILCTKEQARILAARGPALDAAMDFWPGALTAVLPASPRGEILSGLPSVGLRVPAGAFMADLFKEIDSPLYASSANMHGLPPLEREETVLDIFCGKADIIIKGGFLKAKASCVADFTVSPPKIIRRGGFSDGDIEILFSKMK